MRAEPGPKPADITDFADTAPQNPFYFEAGLRFFKIFCIKRYIFICLCRLIFAKNA